MKKRLLTALLVLTGMLLLTASIVWAQSALVEKTGQTTSYRTSDDGDLQKGVANPSPRFTDNGDKTVTDNLTGLMWAKDAHMTGAKTWSDAIDYANNLSLGTSCGVPYTDWRLPNLKELLSLIDLGGNFPALPTSYPFTNVQPGWYRSSTTFAFSTDSAWLVNMSYGSVDHNGPKTANLNVWPVRSGN